MKSTIKFIFLLFLFILNGKSEAQLKISDGAKLNVYSDSYLLTNDDLIINNGGILSLRGCATIGGTITNNVGVNGLIVESEESGTGSLIESTGISATIERFILQDIYHYITSPVSSQSIALLQVGAAHTDFDLFWYDENYTPGPSWIDASAQSGTMEIGLGYTYTYNTADRTLDFQGTTNQGNIVEPVTYTYNAATSTSEWYFGWNLLGNPYPSRISAANFINDASNTAIYGTLYFWDEGTSFSNGRNDYGTWNLTGGTSGGGGKTPNGFIDVGQAFFVHHGSGTGQSSSTVSFKNSMRVHDEAVFFKSGAPWRFKISLENDEGDYNETLIGFVPGCSEGFDDKFDGYKLKGNSQIAIYTALAEDDGYNYAIQALPSLTSEGITVKLGIHSGKEGFYSLKVVSIENFNDTVSVYLEDAYQNTFTNLLYAPEYHFAVEEAGEHNDRFYLHFNNYGVGIQEDKLESEFHIYSFYGDIVIERTSSAENTMAMIFDTGGKLLHIEKLNNDRSEIKLGLSRGIYLVRIISNEKSFSTKILISNKQ